MATVSELCETIASATHMPLGEVKKYARALINSGDLPKAIGRSVPQTDMHQRAKLILAIAASGRPSDCALAMRERYEAKACYGETEMTAGEVLTEELRELASKRYSAFQKWSYSKIEVSRGGIPMVRFLINENVRHFSGFDQSQQLEFLGGIHLAESEEDMVRLDKEHERTRKGLPVSAYVSGEILMAIAFGSIKSLNEARREIIEAHRHANECGDC